jgi:hypothetical protein
MRDLSNDVFYLLKLSFIDESTDIVNQNNLTTWFAIYMKGEISMLRADSAKIIAV